MPYIEEERKNQLIFEGAKTPGELNYLITSELISYLQGNGLSYQTINDVLGALDGASKEFYRRVAVPYEEKKIKANGDVYPCDLLD